MSDISTLIHRLAAQVGQELILLRLDNLRLQAEKEAAEQALAAAKAGDPKETDGA